MLISDRDAVLGTHTVVPAPSEVAPTGEPVALVAQPVRVSAAVATAVRSAARTLRMPDSLPGRACRRMKVHEPQRPPVPVDERVW